MRRILCGVLAVAAAMVFASSALAGFGLKRFSEAATNRNGSQDVQAGSHPYALTTTFTLHKPSLVGGTLIAQGSLKDVRLELPPGFVGDPNATPKCTYTEFMRNDCPNDTAIGTALTYVNEAFGEEYIHVNDPVYNIEPSPGVPAEFAFRVDTIVPVFLDASVRTGGDYGITENVSNIPAAAVVDASKVTIWGVPAEASHDALRGTCLSKGERDGAEGLGVGEDEQEGPAESLGDCPAGVPVLPLLTNPTSCGVPRRATLSVDSWEKPGDYATGENVASKAVSMPELSGCEKLDFSPSISVTPDGAEGNTPTGLNVNVHVPQESTLNPVGLAEADVKDTEVTLPVGVELSPSAADGLLACSPVQIGLHGAEPSVCPEASKVGTVEITTPLLPEPLTGSVYLATQDENPFGSLIALYIVAENPTYGVRVKLAGQTTLDPVTGQLTTTFEETPQLPFSDLKLAFFGTARAPLTTPPLCGAYTTESVFTPWSGTPPVDPSSSFQITSGPANGPCQDPQPFTPGFTTGSTNLQAGAFTPFTLTMSRPDADQELGRVEMQMPPGLLGSLDNVKLCGEPQAADGTCGPESLIGSTIVSAGLGNDPYTVTGGKVYITTGYGGGNYGLSIVNPAVAGPFNLGIVVVRAAIFVNPHTAALRILSEPLPTRIDGIPLQLQHVNVTINREQFTFNPTNCNPMAITGTLSSSQGESVPVTTPFQVANCGTLAFKPQFAVSTSGKTSRANGASLHVKLTYPSGPYDANIAKVKVDLPKQLPSRLTTLEQACPAATFEANPAGCPPASIVGYATALTPVLPVALEGPAYFVSYGGAKFPELVIVLQGYGTTVDLHGETFINKAGITSSTFPQVPDVPVGTFELTLPQGKYSALAANGNLCTSKLLMPTIFVGQNGTEIHESTPIIATGCSKHKKTKKASKD